MQLNLMTDYAIRCCLCLAAEGKAVSSKDICSFAGISRGFAQKILRLLRDNGVVDVTMGSHGGYSLMVPPDQLTLSEIMNIMEDTLCINRCLEEDRYCSRGAVESCPVRRFYVSVQGYLDNAFKSVTLQDLLDDAQPGQVLCCPAEDESSGADEKKAN